MGQLNVRTAKICLRDVIRSKGGSDLFVCYRFAVFDLSGLETSHSDALPYIREQYIGR